MSRLFSTVSRALSTSTQRSKHAALRILFCGSDAFSIASLTALQRLRASRPELIDNIDVLYRPPKPTGRGLKVIREVPIAQAARDLDLKTVTLDNNSDWDTLPVDPPDLIVTASFGLLVPKRVILGAQHGGINVHPSLLPQFRGAAPIQYALMHRVKQTGVSVQTMHPTKFDHGIVMAQTPYSMPDVPTYHQLVCDLGAIGGDLLSNTIEQGLFVEPKQTTSAAQYADSELIKAPKITPRDREIQWQTWTAEDIIARDTSLGMLWDESSIMRTFSNRTSKLRITFAGPWRLVDESVPDGSMPGNVVMLSTQRIGFVTADNKIVQPVSATAAGELRGSALPRLATRLQHKLEAASKAAEEAAAA